MKANANIGPSFNDHDHYTTLHHRKDAEVNPSICAEDPSKDRKNTKDAGSCFKKRNRFSNYGIRYISIRLKRVLK
jgi:hypothetical protein